MVRHFVSLKGVVLVLLFENTVLMKNLHCRLTNVEDLTKATMKKLTQGMSEHNKAMSAAKTDEEKSSVVRTLTFSLSSLSQFYLVFLLWLLM